MSMCNTNWQRSLQCFLFLCNLFKKSFSPFHYNKTLAVLYVAWENVKYELDRDPAVIWVTSQGVQR